MTSRNHVTSTDLVEVQQGTMAEIADALGVELDAGEENTRAIVLNDSMNQESFVVKGTPEEHMRLAFGVAANALGTDTQLRKVIEEALGDAYAYRLGEASGITDPALEDEDREPMERFTQLASQLGLTIY